jgi:hypothetical protein
MTQQPRLFSGFGVYILAVLLIAFALDMAEGNHRRIAKVESVYELNDYDWNLMIRTGSGAVGIINEPRR